MANITKYQYAKTNYPGRSAFDLNYSKIFNCDMGQLIPVCEKICVPGDFFSIGNETVVRFTPLVAPILHEINATVHYFFVSNRLVDDDWVDFITGGEDGQDATTLPRWDNHSDTALYSLWDYFGFPTGVTVPASHKMAPVDYPKRAYNLIWNEWYRDETLQTELTINTAKDVQKRNWTKDYFTSALPWTQRGTSPSFPLTGDLPITGIGKNNTTWSTGPQAVYETDGTGTVNYANYQDLGSADANRTWWAEEDPNNSGYPNIRVDMSGATTFDIEDVRLSAQIQKWMELNARAGARYPEFIRGHFGTDVGDHQVQRPVYIGGTKQSVIVSEVLQTSSSDATSDQGNLAGHALSADTQFAGKYRCKEYGMIIGLMSIMPVPVYGQGIDRQWLQETRYDFYHPEFANLSEDVIYSAELFMDGSANDDDVFGYQGIYDHLRTSKDVYCGDMRSTFDYWHLGRQFSSVPSLNSAFITCTPRTDIFASTSEPGCIVHINNKITAVRPMPTFAEPGIMKI